MSEKNAEVEGKVEEVEQEVVTEEVLVTQEPDGRYIDAGPEVVRPQNDPNFVDDGILGTVCVECGRWDATQNLPWCRACGGKVAEGTKGISRSLVETNKKSRGMS